MKTRRFIGVSVVGLFIFWACEETNEVTGPEEQNQEEEVTPEEQLLGTWDYGSFQLKVTVTTNKDQTTLDRNSEGEGSIEVVGADTATLTYMTGFWQDEYGTSVTVSNRPWLEWDEYPVYTLYCSRSQWGTWLDLSIQTRNGYRSYYGEGVISLDSETHTLTISGVELYDWEDEESVIVTGELVGGTMDIPANTPTEVVDFTDDDPDQALKFKDNDLFIWVFDDEWFNSGFWELEADTLTLYIDYNGGYVVHYVYTLSGDSLTLEWEDDPCESDDAVCLEQYERSYGLEEGTLTSIFFQTRYELYRSGDELLALHLQRGDWTKGESVFRYFFGGESQHRWFTRPVPHR